MYRNIHYLIDHITSCLSYGLTCKSKWFLNIVIFEIYIFVCLQIFFKHIYYCSGLLFVGIGEFVDVIVPVVSPVSNCFNNLNKAAASRIRLNSIQKACTSINSSLKKVRKTD